MAKFYRNPGSTPFPAPVIVVDSAGGKVLDQTGLISVGTAPAAASGRIMSSLANHGGLAGSGGIAGIGGGLAG